MRKHFLQTEAITLVSADNYAEYFGDERIQLRARNFEIVIETDRTSDIYCNIGLPGEYYPIDIALDRLDLQACPQHKLHSVAGYAEMLFAHLDSLNSLFASSQRLRTMQFLPNEYRSS